MENRGCLIKAVMKRTSRELSVFIVFSLVKSNIIYIIHLFNTKYSSNLLAYLLTYRSRLSDVKIIIKHYLEYCLCQCTFLKIKPKICFNATIDEARHLICEGSEQDQEDPINSRSSGCCISSLMYTDHLTSAFYHQDKTEVKEVKEVNRIRLDLWVIQWHRGALVRTVLFSPTTKHESLKIWRTCWAKRRWSEDKRRRQRGYRKTWKWFFR